MSNEDRQPRPPGSLFGVDPEAAIAPAITAIRELAGSPKRVSIIVGRRRVATLLAPQAMQLDLSPGTPWTAELEAAISRLERVNDAKAIAIRRLASRARTRAEIAKWLASKSIEPGIAAEAIERLADVGLLNDAIALDDERRHASAKGLSDAALRERLSRRGLTTVQPPPVPAGDDSARAIELARSELSRRISASSDVNSVARRVMGVLARKGYEQDIASEAVLAAMRERGLEIDLADRVE